MKNYKVIINGTEYHVGIEEIDASEVKSAPAQAPKAAAAPAPAPAGGTNVNAPMPGTILSVKVNSGASVKKGDTILVLEAMKMENEILAPCDGVATVSVAQGATVDTGELLAVIA